MKRHFEEIIPPTMFERLVARADPHRPGRDAARERARLLASRWLALRRVSRGMSLPELAAHARLPQPALVLLEAGLADEALVPGPAWPALCAQLGPAERGLVRAVLRLALGAGQAPPAGLIERLLADVDRAIA